LITTPWYPSPEVPIRGVWTIGHARAIAAAHDVVMLPFSPHSGAAGPFALDDRHDDGVRTIEISYPPPKLPGPGCSRSAGRRPRRSDGSSGMASFPT